MSNIDDRVRSGLRRLASPGDPEGVVELVLRRAAHRRAVRRLASVALATAVVAVTIAGTFVLVRVFPRSEHRAPGATLSPQHPVPHAHGLIAFAELFPKGVRLKTMTPEGSDQQVIPAPPGLTGLLAWSPDGTELAVAIFPLGTGARAIWVMNADGSDPHRVASADNVSRPSWSPDGSSIAYSAQSGDTSSIHVVGKDGSGDRVLYTTQARGTHAVFSAAFSPDGTEILFDQGTDSGFDIFVMNADGSDVRRVTTTGHDYDPHWSPDGTRIAFTRQEGPMQSDIFVMDADGSHVLRLTDGGPGATNLDPDWSPDGSKIAYVAGKTGGPGGLVVVNVDGSDPVTLVQDGVVGISWQPLAVTGSPTPRSAG